MIDYFFKSCNKWLLVGFMTLIPYLGIEAAASTSISSFEPSVKINPEDVRVQFVLLLVNHTIYFHDLTFASLQGLPPEFVGDDIFLLGQNAIAFGQAVYPTDPIRAADLTALFNNYISAGLTYVADLNATRDPNSSLVQTDFQLWLIVSNQLSLALHQVNPCVIHLKKIQNLLIEYTTLQAQTANDLVLTALNNPNFTQSSFLYEKERELAAEKLAPLLAEAVVDNFRH